MGREEVAVLRSEALIVQPSGDSTIRVAELAALKRSEHCPTLGLIWDRNAALVRPIVCEWRRSHGEAEFRPLPV
jgi:hypothetical protein